MNIFNEVLISAARGAAPEIVSFTAPALNSIITPFVTLIISIIGSLITIQTGTNGLFHQYGVFTNASIDSFVNISNINGLKIKDLIFDHIVNTNNDNCVQEFACLLGEITSENVPLMKFLATKIWNNSTALDSISYLDNEEKIFIKSLIDPTKCDKKTHNCDLLRELEKTINKINLYHYQKVVRTTTPAPITARSKFNFDFIKYLRTFNDLIAK